MRVVSQAVVQLPEIVQALGIQPERVYEHYHVSDLITWSTMIAKRTKAPDYSGVPGLAEMGLIWEHAVHALMLARAQAQNACYIPSPPPPVLDNTTGSPDGLWIDSYGPCLVEVKLKFGRMPTVEHEERWLMQTRSYAKMLGLTRVWFVVGAQLHQPPRVLSQETHLEYSQQELDENWQMLRHTADYLRERGIGPLDATKYERR